MPRQGQDVGPPLANSRDHHHRPGAPARREGLTQLDGIRPDRRCGPRQRVPMIVADMALSETSQPAGSDVRNWKTGGARWRRRGCAAIRRGRRSPAVETRRAAHGLREKIELRRVGSGGAGGFHDFCRDGGAQQVVQELMRQAGAAAFAQDDGATSSPLREDRIFRSTGRFTAAEALPSVRSCVHPNRRTDLQGTYGTGVSRRKSIRHPADSAPFQPGIAAADSDRG